MAARVICPTEDTCYTNTVYRQHQAMNHDNDHLKARRADNLFVYI